MKKNVLIAAEVPVELDQEARLEAARRRVSKSKVIRLALTAFLQKPEAVTTGYGGAANGRK